MRLERRPAGKNVAGDRVALHIANTALILAFGASPVRRACPWPEAPIPGKSVQPLIKHHLARGRIVVINQTPGVVEYDFFRNAAKMAERSLHSIKPRRLPLVPEG